MTSEIFRSTDQFVRWDEFRRYPRPIDLPFDPFLSTDALETGIATFSNTLKSAKFAGRVSRPHEAINHFPDLIYIAAEMRRIRRRWQRYKQDEKNVD